MQRGQTICHQQFPICSPLPVSPHWYVNISELPLLGFHQKRLYLRWCVQPTDICDYIAQSKWSSLLWTLMSYLFSWRGYREMIWRWRSVPFQPFLSFFYSSGREKMAVWHQGRQGSVSNLFTQASRQAWARHGTACKHRAHVQKSGISQYLYHLSVLNYSLKDLTEA